MNQGRCGNEGVDHGARAWNLEAAPEIGDGRVHRHDPIGKCCFQPAEPGFESICLHNIVPMTLALDPATNLPQDDYREMDIGFCTPVHHLRTFVSACAPLRTSDSTFVATR